jgi:transcriptional regulator with XRE-family HTH domain
MTLGEKIRSLRVVRKWSQDDLGEKLGIDGRHISRYENDHVKPRQRVLQKMAELFETPLEQLLATNPPGTASITVQDPELRGYIEQIETLDAEDRLVVKRILKMMVTNKRVQSLMAG